MKKALLFILSILAFIVFMDKAPVFAYDRYRETTAGQMYTDSFTVDFQKLYSADPVPTQVELIIKGQYIGYGTPYASSSSIFRFTLERGCQDPIYPEVDYITAYSSYGYYKDSIVYRFTLSDGTKIEEYGEFPIVLRDGSGYMDNAGEVESLCEVKVSGATTPMGGGSAGNSLLAPLFDLIAGIINSFLSALLGK